MGQIVIELWPAVEIFGQNFAGQVASRQI